jgi:hypothetical protein
VKTDPNNCIHSGGIWALIHDAVAHPLLALSGWSGWARRFHAWSSEKAWPRTKGGV